MPRVRFLPTITKAIKLLGGEFMPTQEVEMFMAGIKQYIDAHYTRTPNIYSVTKKIIRKEYPTRTDFHQIALDTFRETPEERKNSDIRARGALETRNDNVTIFQKEYVLGLIHRFLQNDNIVDVCIGLQLACGCRQRDLFDDQVCNFLRVSDQKVMQQGSSKHKGHFAGIKTLVGCDSDRFLTMLRFFRNELNKDEREIEVRVSRWNKVLSRRTRFLFPAANQKRVGTHMNRAIHAALIRDLHKGVSAPRGVQRELGHKDMRSSLHYLHVDVAEEGFSQEI